MAELVDALDSKSSAARRAGSTPALGTMKELKFYCDDKRHLVCIPYSKDNLHLMAKELNIKKCWFHKDHYDIPKRRIQEIKEKCEIVSPRDILSIIKHGVCSSVG